MAGWTTIGCMMSMRRTMDRDTSWTRRRSDVPAVLSRRGGVNAKEYDCGLVDRVDTGCNECGLAVVKLVEDSQYRVTHTMIDAIQMSVASY